MIQSFSFRQQNQNMLSPIKFNLKQSNMQKSNLQIQNFPQTPSFEQYDSLRLFIQQERQKIQAQSKIQSNMINKNVQVSQLKQNQYKQQSIDSLYSQSTNDSINTNYLSKIQQLRYQQTNNQNYSYQNQYQLEKFNDDEVISNLSKGYKQFIESDKIIELKLQSQYNKIQLKKDKKQLLTTMVSVIAKEIETQDSQQNKPGIDLICVIDKSGSMQGEKIQRVKDSLIQLLFLLTDKDRLCLIVFDGESKRLTKLKSTGQQNRSYFINAINSIEADDETDIFKGMNLAFKQIEDRKFKNQVTSVFLLSDGQDPNSLIQIEQYLFQNKSIFTIHTFGYGQDHDVELMTSISKAGHGSFYFIQDTTLLSQFFADALGRLSSICAENLQLTVKCKPLAPFDTIKIKKLFGDFWKFKNDHLSLNFPQMASGTRKDFVLLIELPQYQNKILDNQSDPIILEAKLNFQDTFSKQKYILNDKLRIQLFSYNEQFQIPDQNKEVMKEYLRVITTDAIIFARQQCEQQQNEQAVNYLKEQYHCLTSDTSLSKVSGQAIQDIEQAIQASKRSNYNKYGNKQMSQMSLNNYQQEGSNAIFNEFGQQSSLNVQSVFQNKQSMKMVQTVKNKSIN